MVLLFDVSFMFLILVDSAFFVWHLFLQKHIKNCLNLYIYFFILCSLHVLVKYHIGSILKFKITGCLFPCCFL